MSDPYPFRTQIEQILRKNPRSHFAKRFLGMQRGLTDAEMAEEAARAGEGVQLERIAYVRETVRMTLDGQLADRTTRAQSQFDPRRLANGTLGVARRPPRKRLGQRGWRERYCVDMRARMLFGPEDYVDIDRVNPGRRRGSTFCISR
jgi:hypothetical protein